MQIYEIEEKEERNNLLEETEMKGCLEGTQKLSWRQKYQAVPRATKELFHSSLPLSLSKIQGMNQNKMKEEWKD